MDIITYALSKKIAAHALSGVQSMSVNGQTLIINTKDSGVLTITFPTPKDGVSVVDIDVNANNQIVFTMSDGTEIISGKVPTVKGDAGFSPIITENADNTDKIYKLDITTADSTFTTPNLKGADGQGGTGGSGEENIIDSISVNGVNVAPDENKNVDITVPTVTNDLTDELKSSYDEAVAAKHTHDNKTVLDGITAEKVESWDKAEENVQSDWNETDDTADGFIKNKPTIPDIAGLATEIYVDNKVADYTKTVDLADVATSGSYNDLADKPTIPSLDGYAKTSEIPSKVSELTNDSNYQTAEQVSSTVATEIAKVVADAPEDLNTLKEMSDWIAGHEDDASAMNSAIQANKSDIATLQTDKVDKETGKSLLADTDKANYDDTVSKAHTHENKSVLDGITNDKVTAWDNKSDFSGNYLDLNNKPTIPKGDGTTITMDEDGTLHGKSKVDEMTGATADKNGTSGTVPAPTAGQEGLFLRGDGTWAEAKQDLSAYYNNANYDIENNKLQLMNGDTVLKEIEISGGGSTKIPPKATVNPKIINGNAKCKITWGDPDDVIADGVILSTWKGTKLVMKETGYPENENDGTVIVDNKTKDAYVSTGYEVTGLTNSNTYYFKLFPYSTDGIYNYQDSNKLLGNPSLVKLDSCTNMNLSLAMGSVTVSWEDPNAEKTVDGNTATWAKTVLVYKQGSTAPSSVSDGIVAVEETTRNKYSANGFTVNGLTNGKQYSFSLFAISTEGVSSDATTATANLWATLIITTGETTLYGKEVAATYGSSTVRGTFNNVGSATLQIPWIGETTITSTDGTDTATSKVTISSYGAIYNNELSFFKIVTFADGTDEEIAKMVQAHYNNKINLSDYWAVGDTRTVHLSAMEATGVGESHRAQNVQFVIGDLEHDDLATPINGHTKAAVTLLQKDCLMDAANASNPVDGEHDAEIGYMNSSNTNVGGWKSCARRTWCNNVYFNALPRTWQSMVKTVNKKVSAGNNSSTIETVQDKIFLAAEIEIFGSIKYSFEGEGAQYQYYKNATANRYKMPKWDSSRASHSYLERSPNNSSAEYFCFMRHDGVTDYTYGNANKGFAPCLCI